MGRAAGGKEGSCSPKKKKKKGGGGVGWKSENREPHHPSDQRAPTAQISDAESGNQGDSCRGSLKYLGQECRMFCVGPTGMHKIFWIARTEA